jgi:hypothetical protein
MSAFAPNSEAMSEGALSDPSLIGSTFVQIEAPNSNQRPSMKNRHRISQIRNATQKCEGLKNLR